MELQKHNKRGRGRACPVLARIADQLDAAKKYTEKEVNEIIRPNIEFGDIELACREMFQYTLNGRLRDGSAYWREQV